MSRTLRNTNILIDLVTIIILALLILNVVNFLQTYPTSLAQMQDAGIITAGNFVIFTLWHLYGPAMFGIFLYAAVNIRQILRDTSRGDLFKKANAQRLRILGVLMIILPMVSTLMFALQNLPATATSFGAQVAALPSALSYVVNGFPAFLEYGLAGILLGLLIITIGEVIKEGKYLKQEADLTI